MKNNKLIWIIVLFLFFSIGFNFYFYFLLKKDDVFQNEYDRWLLEIENIEFQKPGEKNISKELFSKIENNDNKENLYQIIDEKFNELQVLDDFLKFDNDYNSIYYFLILSKKLDKQKWYKYVEFLLQREGISYEWNIKNNIDKLFQDLKNNNKIKPIIGDESWDLLYFFNTLPIEDWLNLCNELLELEDYYEDINSCKEKIYFYRATKENWYCEKISDPYKVRLCNDFLNYQNK